MQKYQSAPCKDCICVPVCRFKGYHPLVSQCRIIKDILYRDQGIDISTRTKDFNIAIFDIFNALNPQHWIVENVRGSVEISGRNLKRYYEYE
ncbi:MAG: hypothetical protein ACTSW1_07710 [Candidatus Hodarchaeales archaeon]